MVNTRDSCILKTIYTTHVLPILCFSSSVWNPYKIKDIKKLEKIQRIISRIIVSKSTGVTDTPYKERLRILSLESVQDVLLKRDLINAFRILRQESCLRMSDYFVWKPTRGRNGPFSFYIPHTRSNVYLNSFFMRSARDLLKLPTSILSLETSKEFKQSIEFLNVHDYIDVPDIKIQ